MSFGTRHCRRSFVMLAVLAIVGSAILIATSLLYMAQSQAMSAAVAADTEQSRALAWSGVQAVMSKLNDQRERILAGQSPELDSQLVIYETSTRAGVARLLHASGEQSLIAEAGKLDLNGIDAESLAKTTLVDKNTATAMVEYRDQTLRRPFQSVAELLNTPSGGLTAEVLYGPVEALSNFASDESSGESPQQSASDRGRLDLSNRFEQAKTRRLADVVTVFSIEPSVQQDGKPRINLNVPWTEELGRQIEDRFGKETAAEVKKLYDGGVKFKNDVQIFQTLRQMKVPLEDWPAIVDAFTTQAGQFNFGRLDINTASAEAMQALPGVTPDQAQRMVSMRQELTPAERATIAWPAIAQIIPPEAYDQLADKITTRCWTYRVRLAAGEVNADEPNGPLANRTLVEAVIDLSSSTPRLAYLRDITLLQDTIRLAASASQYSPAESEEPEQSEQTNLPSDDKESEQPTTKPESADGATTQPATPENEQPAAASSAQNPNKEARRQKRIGRWIPGD